METKDVKEPYEPCTPKDLMDIITDGGDVVCMPSSAYNQVYPDVYIGERSFALNKYLLKKVGITHVLNAAQGTKFGCVNSSETDYLDTGITFHGIRARDMNGFKILPHLDEAADFIEDGLVNKGKVLVNCVEGFSRSATVVTAFLMIKRKMDVREALRVVRAKREVCPNDGFMKQLCELNERLRADSKDSA